MQPNHQADPLQGTRNVMNILFWLAQTGALTVEVFLHRRFGARYVGLKGPAAIILIPVVGSIWEPADPRPLMWFLVAFVVMGIIVRLDVLWRSRRGDDEHSYYSGYPRLLPRSWYRLEMVMKGAMEPLLVWAAGALTVELNKPLGNYLIFAAVCLFLSNLLGQVRRDQHVAALRDALIEQQYNAEILRELQGQR